MSSPKVFVTGVTGYVGGDALYLITRAHPEWHYSFLVRDENRGKTVKEWFPSARIVLGDLDNMDLLETESAAADIVMHFASSDHEAGARAIVAGMAKSTTPVFYIHTSGTASLLHPDINANRFGEPGTKVWDDIADVAELTTFPDSVLHTPVDKIALQAANRGPHVHPALVCPPAIVGIGRGPVNQRSIQTPILIETTRNRRRGYQVGAGKSAWSFVHVHDLSDVYLRLAEAAAAGGGSADWGSQAWYFTDNGDLEWSKVSRRVVAALHARDPSSLDTTEIELLSPAQIREILPFALGSYGANSLSRGTRTRQVLGWKPSLSDHLVTVDETVQFDLDGGHSRLTDMQQGHFPAH